MATMYVDHSGAELSINGGTLAIRCAGVRMSAVPIKLLDRLVIRSRSTSLQSGSILKLADAGVTIAFVGARAGESVAMVLGRAHNDAAVRLAQARRVSDADTCCRVATTLVRAKLRRQLRILGRFMSARPDVRRPLLEAHRRIGESAAKLASSPPSDIGSIRGLEGAAARAFFQGLAAVLPPAAGFEGRNRRPPRDPVNVCLSLAYTLLHVDAVRACHMAGLDPLLGFYHRPAFGRESLACDLIEPLRPSADLWVWEQWRARELRVEHFSLADGVCLMHKAGREAFYPRWEAAAISARRWLRRECARLARQLRAEGMPLLGGDDGDET